MLRLYFRQVHERRRSSFYPRDGSRLAWCRYAEMIALRAWKEQASHGRESDPREKYWKIMMLSRFRVLNTFISNIRHSRAYLNDHENLLVPDY